jgi:hypothetical protein
LSGEPDVSARLSNPKFDELSVQPILGVIGQKRRSNILESLYI